MSLGEANPWLPKGIPPPVFLAFLLLLSQIQEVSVNQFPAFLKAFPQPETCREKRQTSLQQGGSWTMSLRRARAVKTQAPRPVLLPPQDPATRPGCRCPAPNPSPYLFSFSFLQNTNSPPPFPPLSNSGTILKRTILKRGSREGARGGRVSQRCPLGLFLQRLERIFRKAHGQ